VDAGIDTSLYGTASLICDRSEHWRAAMADSRRAQILRCLLRSRREIGAASHIAPDGIETLDHAETESDYSSTRYTASQASPTRRSTSP
jgi:hypothetical protein